MFNLLLSAKPTNSFSWQSFFWKSFYKNTTPEDTSAYDAAASVISTIETVLWIAIGVVGLAAVIYAVYLGINLAKASEQSKRDEARKHLITVIIAIGVTLLLVVFFLYLLPGILGAFIDVKPTAPTTP